MNRTTQIALAHWANLYSQNEFLHNNLENKKGSNAIQKTDEPEEIEVQPEEITVKKITQELYHIAKSEKFNLFLKVEIKTCIDFVNGIGSYPIDCIGWRPIP